MDAIVNDIAAKWNNKYVEFGSEQFKDFLTDVNLLIAKRHRLKHVYEQNKELYQLISNTIRGLAKSVYFPRPVPKPKEETPEIEYKPEKFMTERVRKNFQTFVAQQGQMAFTKENIYKRV